MEYTNADLSNFIKFQYRFADESKAEAFWINSYSEGRKGESVSRWTLVKQKPEDKYIKYYPAYSLKYFNEHILPNLLEELTVTV